MFGFINKMFLAVKDVSSCNVSKSVSMNNQECKIRTQIIEINSNGPLLYPDSIELNKCSGSCNNINDPYVMLKTQISKYLI